MEFYSGSRAARDGERLFQAAGKKIQVSLFVSVASRLLRDVCERQVTKIYSALRCTDQ